MPKAKQSIAQKAKSYQQKQPEVFMVSRHGSLFCKLCQVDVSCDKQFNVTAHLDTTKHKTLSQTLSSQPKLQVDIEKNGTSFSYIVTEAFLSADIPLYKLNHPKMKNMFQSIGHPLPSESTCRQKVPQVAADILTKIQGIIEGKQIFIQYDETDILKSKYSNILVGTLDEPGKSYLVDTIFLDKNIDASTVVRHIDDVVRKFNIERQNFVLLLSDAARYMVSAGNTLKVLFPNLFHVTCTAHLWHNCALKIKEFYPDVDNLISKVKAATLKNKTRQQLFTDIGTAPVPVVTRWGSWLNAAMYYCENLVAVKDIFSGLEGGVLVENAKKALDKNLTSDLVQLQSCYRGILTVIEKIESKAYSIKDAVKEIYDSNFGEDPVGIKEYILKRISKNDIIDIVDMKRENISPSLYAKLLNCQATSCDVERSFSLMENLLEKYRNFKKENIKYYMICLYNKF